MLSIDRNDQAARAQGASSDDLLPSRIYDYGSVIIATRYRADVRLFSNSQIVPHSCRVTCCLRIEYSNQCCFITHCLCCISAVLLLQQDLCVTRIPTYICSSYFSFILDTRLFNKTFPLTDLTRHYYLLSHKYNYTIDFVNITQVQNFDSFNLQHWTMNQVFCKSFVATILTNNNSNPTSGFKICI